MTQVTHASLGVRHLRHTDGAAIGEHSAKPDGDPNLASFAFRWRRTAREYGGATISGSRPMRALRPFAPD
jgi:hypothetical protein